MAEWVMPVLTFVYVVATIFISFSNYRSSKATRDQIKESRDQFVDSNRAFVNVDFEIIRSGLLVLKIMNNGRRTAKYVNMTISKDFIDIVPDPNCKNRLKTLSESIFSIGIDQAWYITLGTTTDFQKLSEKPLEINFDYSDCFSKYMDSRIIDIAHFSWCLMYDSPINDIRDYMKTISESVKKISVK